MKKTSIVALGLILAGCAARGGGQAKRNDGYGVVALGENSGGCKKRYVTPYMKVNLGDLRRGKTKVTWILTNACEKEPPSCRSGSRLELEFYKWEYTPERLEPNVEPKRKEGDQPSPLECAPKNEVKLGTNYTLRCGASQTAKPGTYRFQVRFSCDGNTIDNWDPVIYFDGEGDGGGG